MNGHINLKLSCRPHHAKASPCVDSEILGSDIRWRTTRIMVRPHRPTPCHDHDHALWR
jgi:hypothetical protein